jgi:hypothetical protein
MFLFAHLFTGLLLGIVFQSLTGDRRIVPVCIAGSLFPDLLDKPLSLLAPGLFGSTRTVGHTLLILMVLGFAGLVLWHRRHTLLGVAFAVAVFSHQISDTLWNLAGTWYFPLYGMFPVMDYPEYLQHFIWMELSSPSEWVFAGVTLAVFLELFPGYYNTHLPSFSSRSLRVIRVSSCALLGIMGISLLAAGIDSQPQAFLAPAYDPATFVLAGILALGGAIVLVRWPGAESG